MNLVNGGSGSKNGGSLSVVGGGMLNNSGGGSSLLNAAPDLTQRVLMSNSMRGDEHAKLVQFSGYRKVSNWNKCAV